MSDSQVPDPKTWATGGDAMTTKQEGFIQSLAEEKGVDVDTASLDKGSASQKIEELKNAPRESNKEGGTTSTENKQGDAIDKDPKEWTTGSEDATQKQRAYIGAMAQRAGDDVNVGGLDKAEASKKIEELKGKTGM